MAIKNKLDERYYQTANREEALFLFIAGHVICGINEDLPRIYMFEKTLELETHIELYKVCKQQFDNPGEYIFNDRG